MIYRPSPTLERFHESTAFFRGIRGPVGSGKTVAACNEIMAKFLEQEAFGGVRRSRWAMVRNTYPELRSTTIKTWLDWFEAEKFEDGDISMELTRMVYGSPITGFVRVPLPDGTRIESELIFLSMDVTANDDKALRKLKSLELTGAFANEGSELDFSVIGMLGQRVGRYPAKGQGGCTWRGIVSDTNSCTVSNWWHDKEMNPPKGWEFFKQPGALLLQNGEYVPNPDAENIEHHTFGYDYYYQQLAGNTKAWVNVFVLNNFGSHVEGNLVYADYDAELNTTAVEYDAGASELIWTHDFNFTPLSSIIMQRKGDVVYAVDEIVLESAVAVQAAVEFCDRYRGYRGTVKIYGDSSGRVGEKHGHESDYITIEQFLRKEGFTVKRCVPKANPAIKNGQASLQAKICDATGARTFFVNAKKCPTLHKGLSTLQLKKGSTFQEEDGYFQHITTAARYYTAVEFPIAGKRSTGGADIYAKG